MHFSKALPVAFKTAPDGSEIRELLDVSGGGMCHCTLPARGVSLPVRHKTIEEIWYCLEGRGQVWCKLDGVEEITEARPGVSLRIPVGTHFQFRNIGDTPLCFIIATMPPWPGMDEAVPVEGHWEVAR